MTELSVAIPSVPAIKEQVRHLRMEECQALAARSLEAADAAEVRNLIGDL